MRHPNPKQVSLNYLFGIVYGESKIILDDKSKVFTLIWNLDSNRIQVLRIFLVFSKFEGCSRLHSFLILLCNPLFHCYYNFFLEKKVLNMSLLHSFEIDISLLLAKVTWFQFIDSFTITASLLLYCSFIS